MASKDVSEGMRAVSDISGDRSMRIEPMPPNILAYEGTVTSLSSAHLVSLFLISVVYTFGLRGGLQGDKKL
jgi:hypothetical protein